MWSSTLCSSQLCSWGAPNLWAFYKQFCVKMLYQHIPNYQPSHSHEHFNVPRNFRLLRDISWHEEPTFASMDQPAQWPKGLVPTTTIYHKQASYTHHNQLWLSEKIPSEAVYWQLADTVNSIMCVSQDVNVIIYCIFTRFSVMDGAMGFWCTFL